jgi:hypothetical protein
MRFHFLLVLLQFICFRSLHHSQLTQAENERQKQGFLPSTHQSILAPIHTLVWLCIHRTRTHSFCTPDDQEGIFNQEDQEKCGDVFVKTQKNN